MQALPKEFLQKIARDCNFTSKQSEAFIAFYSSDASKEKVAQELGISVSALNGRLTRAYENIGSPEDHNKIEELRCVLWNKYQNNDENSIYYFYAVRKIEIAKVENINRLDLRYKKLTKLPKSIGDLTNLTELYLFGNQLSEVPESIGNLTNLIELNLSRNQLVELPKSLGDLTNLIELNLSRNQLIELPKSLGDLTNLTKLYLFDNQLIELPKSLGKLINLTELYLFDNQLSELPKSLGNLTNLTKLYLSRNRIAELPESISKLTNLTLLYLSRNQLVELPSSIGKLINLASLDLRDNQLVKLPKSISNLTNLTSLYLSDNSLETPPLEIAEQGIDAIREYFRQLEEEGEDHIYEAKLLILGEGGAGKTTLAKKIQNSDYQLPEESNDTSTEGIDVVPWKFNLDNGQEFCINIWDFGGQEIYHATHQFFLTKRSLYVLVADSRKEDTDFYYWLNVVELLSDNSPLLIVNNEKLERKRDINEKALRGQFTNLKETLSSNLKTNRGLPEILTNIKHYIQNLPHIGQGLPKTWVKVRQALENDRRNHITLDEYLDICQENGFTLRKDKLQLSGYLHDLGVCLHFQESEDSLLYKTVILKPEWGTKAVYAVLDNDDVKRKQGCFTREDLKTIWHQDTYAEMRGELLELMKKFQLCYEIPSRKNTFIAPQLLSENQPDYQWHEQHNLTLHYSYPDFMPKGLITRFIVTMHQYIERQDQDRVWKTGVVLAKDKAKAEVIEYYGKRKIEIRISGANKKDLMTLITYEIDKLSDSFNRLNYSKQIPCNCSVCKSNQVPHFYNFNKLKQFISDRQDKIQCQESYEMVNVLGLIDDVIIWHPEKLESDFYQDQDRNNIIRTSRNKHRMTASITEREVYISYAWKEESEAITDLIDETFNDQGINIIRDKKDLGFKGRIKQFMEEIGRGKCVIVVISPKYLKSQNCMFELIEIASNGDFYDRIFPIVLSGTDIYDPVQRLKYIKYWENKSTELDNAMKEVSGANLQGFREDLDLYTKIRHTIAGLTDTLQDMNTLPTEDHLESEFKELLTAVIKKLEE